MRGILIGATGASVIVVALMAQGNNPNPKPTCTMCPGTYIPLSELDAYRQKAVKENLVDQQVRDIEIGKAHVGIGMVHRGKLAAPAKDSVAEHDLVSEVYHIIDGTATLKLGPDITNMVRRPATQETVRLFNGPGNNGSEITNGKSYNLNLPAEYVGRIQTQGMSYGDSLDLPPGQYSLRVAVRDNIAGRVGSVAAPLEIK